jgi:hypothetical protein
MHPSTGRKQVHPPSEQRLKDTLREPFQLVEPSDTAYQEACARFEFLASMIAMDTDNDFRAYPWAGEFLLGSAWGHDNNGLAATIEAELTDTWPLLSAGAFGELSRAQQSLTALTEWKAKYARRW